MSLKTWILLISGFAIYIGSSAKFCARRYVNGKWISKGDCGGPGRISGMQKELQLKMKDERKKCIAVNEWTVFQRRVHGTVDFYRDWNDYKKGFGDCDGDMWLGLGELHERTKKGDMELEIKMISNDTGIHWVAKYSTFRIGPGSGNFSLHVSGFSSSATFDALSSLNNQQFSTKDADHDPNSLVNCASKYEGAWWYDSGCGWSNLNGNFNKTGVEGFWWFGPPLTPLRFSEMKFRKRL